MIRRAVVVGATAGIGQACANELASKGWSVIAVGRDRPGRREQILSDLGSKGGSQHEFRTVDAFSLESVKDCAKEISKDFESIDALVMTQGMATVQGFTPTVDGNDQKLTLHYFSRMAFASVLLPSLRKSSEESMPGGPVIVSVLSGGVHGPYKKYDSDFDLQKNYSIKNAADAAGYYNDLGLDALARRPGNERVAVVHSAPGFVSTSWGTEMPSLLKGVIRFAQRFAKPASEAAAHMLSPVFASASGSSLLARPNGNDVGIYIMDEKGNPDKLTKAHTEEARNVVWTKTAEILQKAGIDINE